MKCQANFFKIFLGMKKERDFHLSPFVKFFRLVIAHGEFLPWKFPMPF
jgi:hypothetical protein